MKLSLKRIFFAIPIPYWTRHSDNFWSRESGLIVMALREMGYEAFLVALHPLDPSDPVDTVNPAITCTLEQMSDPTWWSALQPDAIVLNLWSATRYDAIRKAALKVTPRVIERLDASGVRIPRMWFSYYFRQTWGTAMDVGKNAFISYIRTAIFTVLVRYVPSLLEKPMALTMAQLPYVVAESPLAAARIDRHIRMYSNGPNRVAQISNPVYTKTMYYSPAEPKVNALVALARWDAYQKDFPMLIGSAIDFLKRYPDWTFDVVGGGVDRFRHLIDQAPPDVAKRIHIHGKIPQVEAAALNRRAKIHYIASRWEGFCNASVESLCCGCSYVGPIDLAASSYLIEMGSGTIAPRRTRADLCDALCAEAEAWIGGRRDPAAISEKWIAQSGYRQVAEKTLALLESIPASNA